jgi:hypothetical protein
MITASRTVDEAVEIVMHLTLPPSFDKTTRMTLW